jgi:hypothetical protein
MCCTSVCWAQPNVQAVHQFAVLYNRLHSSTKAVVLNIAPAAAGASWRRHGAFITLLLGDEAGLAWTVVQCPGRVGAVHALEIVIVQCMFL